jgi:hypothetical protein
VYMGAKVESMYVSEINKHVQGGIIFETIRISLKFLFEIGVYIKPTAAATLIFAAPNLHTNKVYMGAKVESMYVFEIKNHRLHNNECLGDLKFDCAASKKWGLCWRERLACTDCDFVSDLQPYLTLGLKFFAYWMCKGG